MPLDLTPAQKYFHTLIQQITNVESLEQKKKLEKDIDSVPVEETIPVLVDLLSSGDADVRLFCGIRLMQYAPHVEAYRKLFNDPSDWVRREMASATHLAPETDHDKEIKTIIINDTCDFTRIESFLHFERVLHEEAAPFLMWAYTHLTGDDGMGFTVEGSAQRALLWRLQEWMEGKPLDHFLKRKVFRYGALQCSLTPIPELAPMPSCASDLEQQVMHLQGSSSYGQLSVTLTLNSKEGHIQKCQCHFDTFKVWGTPENPPELRVYGDDVSGTKDPSGGS